MIVIALAGRPRPARLSPMPFGLPTSNCGSATPTPSTCSGTPAIGDSMRLSISVRFPPGTTNVTEPRGIFVAGAFVERWTIRRPNGSAGEQVSIEGLPGSVTDVLGRVERLDGTTQVARLHPNVRALSSRLRRTAPASRGPTRHSAFEHPLRHRSPALHPGDAVPGHGLGTHSHDHDGVHRDDSLTLTAAALGWVHVPQPPVEACIALSIVFAAREIVET